MYFIPNKSLRDIPADFQKALENGFYSKTKVVLIVTDGHYTETYHYNTSDAEANLLIDKAKSQVVRGGSNGQGRGAVMD